MIRAYHQGAIYCWCNTKRAGIENSFQARTFFGEDNFFWQRTSMMPLYEYYLEHKNHDEEYAFEEAGEAGEAAGRILKQVCFEEGIRKYIKIHRVGTGDMVIKSACGLVANGNIDINKSIFITDGDKVYFNDQHTTDVINGFFCGDDPAIIEKRTKASKIVSKLVMKDDEISPEEYYRESILTLNPDNLSVEEKTIYDELVQVIVPENKHDYFILVINRIGLTKEVGRSKIIALLSKAESWRQIIVNISAWITKVKPGLVIPVE